MTSQVMDSAFCPCQSLWMNNLPFPRINTPTTAGPQLRLLRRQAGMSQLELALITVFPNAI